MGPRPKTEPLSTETPAKPSPKTRHLDLSNAEVRLLIEKRERQKYKVVRNASFFLLCLIVPGLLIFNGVILYMQPTRLSAIHVFFIANSINLLCFSAGGHFTLSPAKMYRTFLIFATGSLVYVFGVFIMRDKSDIPCAMGAVAVTILAYFLSRRLFKLFALAAAVTLPLGILIRNIQPWDLIVCPKLVCGAESFFVFSSILLFSLFLLLKKHDDAQDDLQTMVQLNNNQANIVSTLIDTTDILSEQLDSLKEVIGTLKIQSKQQLDSAAKASLSLEKISQVTTKTAESAATMLDISKRSHKLVASGEKNFQEIEIRAKQALSRAEDSRSLTESVADAATQLDDINVYLQEILGSLRIMSINAAIQAAKAGHHGRGFQVVVKELATLLTETKDKVATSQKILSTISSDSVKSASLSRAAANSMEQELVAINETTSNLNAITGSFSEMAALAEPISDAIIRENSSIEDVFYQTQQQSGHSKDLEESVNQLHATLSLIADVKKRLSDVLSRN